MTEAIGAASGIPLDSIINGANDINTGSSVQFMFAKLQLEQSSLAKDQAESYMNQIKDIQAEQAKTAEMISMARDLQQQAKNGDKCTTMPQEMVDFMNDRGLKYDTTGNDKLHNKDEWEYNLKSLTNYQDTVGNKTQTLMVYVQDFMGQYNSFLQGANSAIKEGNAALKAVSDMR